MRFNHLKEEQLLRVALGDARARDLQHSRDCVACGGEVLLLETALTDFREAVHGYTEHKRLSNPLLWKVPCRSVFAPVRWAAMAVALVVLLSAPAYRAHLQHNQQMRLQQDSALMQQIDSEISSPVPHAMEPLAAVADWNSGEETQEAPTTKY